MIGAALVLAAAGALLEAQEPPAFRASAEEVLVDFVMRDRRGRQVADLRPEEVELLEDGVPQELRMLSRVEGLRALERASGREARERRLDPARSVRLMVLVFDRLGAEGRALARRAVEDLLRQGILPNTYSAVATLEPRFRILQPFTDEPSLVQWRVERATGARLAKAEGAPDIGRPTRAATAGEPAAQAMQEAVAEMESRLAELEREQRGVGALNGLLSLVLGLRRLEGRKNVILLSEGIEGSGGVARVLIAQANRNHVAFYTVDARGLTSGRFPTAKAEPSQPPQLALARAPLLEELAAETGGLAVAGTNDLRLPLRQAAEDAGADDLASYRPKNRHWDGRFRRLEIRVRRAKVAVQARSGYFALPPGMQALLFPHEIPLLRALSATPMPRRVDYRAGMFRFGPAGGGSVQCVFQIEVPIRHLSVRKNEAAGTYEIHVSFLVLIQDAAGRAVRKATRDAPFSGPLDRLEAFQAGDFLYNDHFPLPAGRYVMESAVADRLGERAGTKRVSFLVPELPQEGPALSSIVLVRRLDPAPPPEISCGEADDRGANPLRFSGGAVTPRLDRSASGPLGFYFVGYGPAGASAQAAEILKDGSLVARQVMEVPEFRDGIFPYFGLLPLDFFAAGDYELRMIFSSGGRAVAEKAGFSVAP